MAVESLMDLPLNVLGEIFSKLPIKTILACRCVCKTLLNLTSFNSFAALHSQNATQSLIIHYGTDIPYLNLFDSQIDITANPAGRFSKEKCRLNPIFTFPDCGRKSGYPVLVNACNGLLYFEMKIGERCSLVCNPITKEYVWVPPQALGDNSNASSLWLGFSPISRVYKVVMFYFSRLPAVKIGAHIHKVGGSTWRDVESTPLDNIYYFNNYVFVDGIGYWICEYDLLLERSPANFMLSFDFETEIFGKIDAPPGFDEEESRRVDAVFLSIGHVGDSLCLMDSTHNLDIWMMDKLRGQWFKKLSLVNGAVEEPLSGTCLKPLQLLSNGEILMLSDGTELVCYDMKSNNFRCIRIKPDIDVVTNIEVVTFVPSFMSLQDML